MVLKLVRRVVYRLGFVVGWLVFCLGFGVEVLGFCQFVGRVNWAMFFLLFLVFDVLLGVWCGVSGFSINPLKALGDCAGVYLFC